MTRKKYFRPQVPRFLIVCEGKETEKLYFEAFRVAYVRDIQVKGMGKSTVNLVNEAMKLKSKGEYDQVWVVFDIDDCTPGQVNDAIRLANENVIQVVYSNQAFELWYLLHFAYHNTSVDRKQYIQKLTRSLGAEYKKNTPGLYMRLLPRQGTAIQNAKNLLTSYTHSDPCGNDPSTTVFKLVEELNLYSRDSRR